MAYKFHRHYGLFLAIMLLFIQGSSFAQNSMGIRFTPNVIAPPKVNNPSPANIYGEPLISFDAGFDYFYTINKRFQLGTGIDLGIIDHNSYIKAPFNAFGTHQGSGYFTESTNSDNYFYYGVSLSGAYTFKQGNTRMKLSAGTNFRYYHHERDPDITWYAFNRAVPWNPHNPASDPPDLEITLPPPGGKIHTNLHFSFGAELPLTNQLDVYLGLRGNLGFKPVADGSFFITMYDQRYDGRFATRSNYIGLDFQLRYLTRNRKSVYQRPEPTPSDNQGFRKAIFAEFLGSSPLLSLNYDMRLKRHVNDGFGIKAGFGLGVILESEQAKFNRYLSFPLGVNYIIGRKNHGLESGINITPQVALSKPGNSNMFEPVVYLNAGYRYQPITNGLLFRLAWTPDVTPGYFNPVWFGASVGYSFR